MNTGSAVQPNVPPKPAASIWFKFRPASPGSGAAPGEYSSVFMTLLRANET